MTTASTDPFFEDFFVGQVIETETATLTEDEIIDFGKRFAPLPYHTDPVAARETMFGEIVAAGYHTASVTFGLFVRTNTFRSCGMGSPGVDRLRWLRPVRPGDTLRVVAEVTEVSPAKEEGGRDAIRIAYETRNQDDKVVMTVTSLHFVRPRPA